MGFLPKMSFRGLWFQLSHKLELQRLVKLAELHEFSADLQDSGVKNHVKISGKGLLDQVATQRIVSFSI